MNFLQLDAPSSKLEKIRNSQKKVMQYVTGKGSSIRLIDEILRLFNDDGDFYICFKRDITMNTQRFKLKHCHFLYNIHFSKSKLQTPPHVVLEERRTLLSAA